MSETKEQEAKEEIINLPIRLRREEYDTLMEAASKLGKNKGVSTYMREVSLANAGDTRSLTVLLRAFLANVNKKK